MIAVYLVDSFMSCTMKNADTDGILGPYDFRDAENTEVANTDGKFHLREPASNFAASRQN